MDGLLNILKFVYQMLADFIKFDVQAQNQFCTARSMLLYMLD